MKIARMGCVGIALVGMAGLTVSVATAAAKAPAYVGKWGANAKQCMMPQDTLDAPLIIAAKGYDQFETHCDFSNIKKTGMTWKLKASCSVEGDIQTQPLSLKVSGDALTYKWGTGAAQKLVRCK